MSPTGAVVQGVGVNNNTLNNGGGNSGGSKNGARSRAQIQVTSAGHQTI